MHSRTRTDRSSRLSVAAPRFSEDSTYNGGFIVTTDKAALSRSIQRRSILEELIATEENYIGDVYMTTFASLPSISAGLRSSINRNLTEIVELHEEILGELHRVVPNSEYTQAELLKQPEMLRPKTHQRWRSLDSVPENAKHISWLQRIPGMIADAQVAEEVAKIFAYSKSVSISFAFAELLKYTTVDDCANSHMEVENTLIRLREATAEINRATDDARMKSILEKHGHSRTALSSPTRIPILAPSRAERARLEALLADVWSRDILPFPGMTTRSRSEHLVRTSASSMMRRLSVASITGSFGRRPGSLTSLPKASADTETGEGDDGSWNASHQDPDTPIEWKSPFGEESGLPMIQDENEARTPDCADTPPSPRSITHVESAEGLYMRTIRRRSPGPPMAVIQTRRDLDAQDTTRISTQTRPRTEPSGFQQSGQGLLSAPVSSEKENLQPDKIVGIGLVF
ncbi:unnamed protein product [Parascedosporium putredinis]|uniref:DH domain-containing protein n=1 Tax=Parascedosporium putredinis TaxID=1442378 RepID=A0A9P1H573_9PEZI|nr:unnamed protein product [Parascedosporium putredinis]CAI7997664.1 unnamed protein product [Parascedosporium putredinis]